MGAGGVESSAVARVSAFLAGQWGEGAAAVQVESLSGDASTRRYFRVREGEATQVLALYPEAFDPSELSFLVMRDLLAEHGLPVPAVHAQDGTLGVVLLQDLGDETLQTLVGGVSESRMAALYDEALDDLVRLQRTTSSGPRRASCFRIAFDVEKLSWELHYFEKHFLEGMRSCSLTTEDRATLAESFHDLAQEIASWPRVLCHRDYHSRNLMHHRERLYWIDFQDARMGPVTYDLVSLLRDSYVALPEDFVADRVEAFRQEAAPEEPRDVFWRRFELMAVQRNLKALGTFGYMAFVRGNAVYLPYVPRTLAYARQNLLKHPELATLHRTLARHVEELE